MCVQGRVRVYTNTRSVRAVKTSTGDCVVTPFNKKEKKKEKNTSSYSFMSTYVSDTFSQGRGVRIKGTFRQGQNQGQHGHRQSGPWMHQGPIQGQNQGQMHGATNHGQNQGQNQGQMHGATNHGPIQGQNQGQNQGQMHGATNQRPIQGQNQEQMHGAANQGLLEGTMTYASRCPCCMTDNYLQSDPNSAVVTCVSCSRAYGKPEHPAVKVLRHECAQLVYRLSDADSRACYAHQEVNYYRGLLIRQEEKRTSARSASLSSSPSSYPSSSSARDSATLARGFADIKSEMKSMLHQLTGAGVADLQAENVNLHATQTKHKQKIVELTAQLTNPKERGQTILSTKTQAELTKTQAELTETQAELTETQQNHQQHAARSTARVDALVREKQSAATQIAQGQGHIQFNNRTQTRNRAAPYKSASA
jgi:hypothetical protein